MKPSIDIKLKAPIESDAVFFSSAKHSKEGTFNTQQDSVISDPDLLGRELISYEMVEADIN